MVRFGADHGPMDCAQLGSAAEGTTLSLNAVAVRVRLCSSKSANRMY